MCARPIFFTVTSDPLENTQESAVCEQTLTALNKGRGAFQEDDVALVCSALGSRPPLHPILPIPPFPFLFPSHPLLKIPSSHPTHSIPFFQFHPSHPTSPIPSFLFPSQLRPSNPVLPNCALPIPPISFHLPGPHPSVQSPSS